MRSLFDKIVIWVSPSARNAVLLMSSQIGDAGRETSTPSKKRNSPDRRRRCASRSDCTSEVAGPIGGNACAGRLRFLKSQTCARDLLRAEAIHRAIRADRYLHIRMHSAGFELAGDVVLHTGRLPTMRCVVVKPFRRDRSLFERKRNMPVFLEGFQGRRPSLI